MDDLQKESGFSILEVIVAIVIIFIVLISFFKFMVQSAETNAQSGNIQTATYVAQQEMEKFFTASKNATSIEQALLDNDYVQPPTFQNTYTCAYSLSNPTNYSSKKTYKKVQNGYTVEITVSQLCDYTTGSSTAKKPLMNILINVYESPNKLKATLENIYVWK